MLCNLVAIPRNIYKPLRYAAHDNGIYIYIYSSGCKNHYRIVSKTVNSHRCY